MGFFFVSFNLLLIVMMMMMIFFFFLSFGCLEKDYPAFLYSVEFQSEIECVLSLQFGKDMKVLCFCFR